MESPSIRIAIASNNPVKKDAIASAFHKTFPNRAFEMFPFSVESGVSAQPKSSEETLQGALNRIAHLKELSPDMDYWTAAEGGIAEVAGKTRVSAWIVIESKEGVRSEEQTASFALPEKIMKIIREGKELNDADKEVFGRERAGDKNGTIGYLTDDEIDRTKYYEHAAILAFLPFKHPELYAQDE